MSVPKHGIQFCTFFETEFFLALEYDISEKSFKLFNIGRRKYSHAIDSPHPHPTADCHVHIASTTIPPSPTPHFSIQAEIYFI
jgi:hypothetical protein